MGQEKYLVKTPSYIFISPQQIQRPEQTIPNASVAFIVCESIDKSSFFVTNVESNLKINNLKMLTFSK